MTTDDTSSASRVAAMRSRYSQAGWARLELQVPNELKEALAELARAEGAALPDVGGALLELGYRQYTGTREALTPASGLPGRAAAASGKALDGAGFAYACAAGGAQLTNSPAPAASPVAAFFERRKAGLTGARAQHKSRPPTTKDVSHDHT